MPESRKEWERIAVLEERSESQRNQIADLVEAIHDLTREVVRINQKLDRHVGFLGGVAFAFSVLGAFIGTCGGELLRKLSRGEM